MRKSVLLVLVAAAACGESTAPPKPEPVRSDTIEARALWVSRFEYSTAADIATIFANAKKANFNIVYLQVRGNSDALYISGVDPCSTRLCATLGGTPPWDPLATAIGHAQGSGIQVHAWINSFIAWNNSCSALQPSSGGNPNHILIDHPDWIMVDSLGAKMQCGSYPDGNGWVSPGNAGVRTHLARVAADIARRYPLVAGVHLDFIRYPGRRWSFDTASLNAFGLDWKTNRAEWEQFRRDLVAAAVKETYDSLEAARPSAVLSAAVWGIYKDLWGWGSSRGYDQYLQDPRDWMNNDKSLDVAVPMTYWRIRSGSCIDFTDWLCLLKDHVAGFAPSGRHVYIGMLADLGADEMVKQIEQGRDEGAQGFSIFSYGSARSTGLFDRLGEGVFRLPARIPAMGWK